MSTSTESVAQTTNTGAAQPAHASYQTVVRPAVDIVEDADSITLQADMPGVSKERLNVRIDGTTLLLDGEVHSAQGPRTQGSSTHFRRSFALSRVLETDRIEATVKDGVLTVRIPKRAELRPRRIEIQ